MNTRATAKGVQLIVGLAVFVMSFSLAQHLLAFEAPQFPLLAPAATNNTSLNWAGYIAEDKKYTEVSGRWNVPKVTGTGGSAVAADATWVGIGGAKEENLIQAGTHAVIEGNDVRYEAWYELIPGDSWIVPVEVHAGDDVSVDIAHLEEDKWQVTLTNNTTGDSYTNKVSHESEFTSAEWIEEMASSARGGFFIPLAEFAGTDFTESKATVDGVQKNLKDLGAKPVTMENYSGDVLATPSVLAQDGESFRVTREDASPQIVLRAHRHYYIVQVEN
ncbi:hypothetical protein KW798_03520 [Candidatus Parcubacteria bacterium]|nr:hypothetical protein [Candidatus Parcubacteria bacterium]